MENFPKKTGISSENIERKTNIFERFKEVIRPVWKYGLAALMAMKSFDVEAQHNHTHEFNNQNVENIHNVPEEKKTFIEGENGFNYYSPELLDSFESFYTHAQNDDTFLSEEVLTQTKDSHSEETLAFLKERLSFFKEKGLEGSKEYELLKKEADTFTVLDSNDEEGLKRAALYEQYKLLLINTIMIEKQREWLKKIVNSDVYLQRLTIETGGDELAAKELQKARLQRLEDHDFYLSNHQFLSQEGISGHVDETYTAFLRNGIFLVQKPDGSTGFIKESKTPIHEFDHQHLIDLMTEYAQNIYSHLSADNIEPYQFENPDYYFDVIELAARKRVLDYELEELGIKKYEEEFTDEHYQKVQQLLKRGELNRNSREFFNSFEKDSVMLIMNTVAVNIDRLPIETESIG